MTEPCDLHERIEEQATENAVLLAAISTKLSGLLVVGTIIATVYLIPTVLFFFSIEKRVTYLEQVLPRIIAQRNADHPNKDKLQ